MKYVPALDGIRALAALLVVCVHSHVPGMSNGRGGVDIFFVLSGYLITMILAREAESGGIHFGAFYLRRARRLYPALLLLVGLVLALAPLWHPRPTAQDGLLALLHLSDYGVAYFDLPGTVLRHTWSLAVEEHFYLLWPLVVAGLCRMQRRDALRALVLAYVLATCWRYYVNWNASDPWLAYYRFDTRLSGLILGSLLAMAPRFRIPYRAITLPLVGAVMLASSATMTVTILPSEWLGALLVWWAIDGAPPLEARPLVYLGRISYGIYLFHWPITILFPANQPWPITLLLTLAGSVMLATLSYYTVERVVRSKPRRHLERGIANPRA